MQRRRLLRLGALCFALLVGPACEPPGVVDVVALTAWPPPQRQAFEQACRQSGALDSIRWRWIDVLPVDDPAQLLSNANHADLIIGVPVAVANLLINPKDQRLVSQQSVGFYNATDADEVASWETLASSSFRSKVAIDDPRLDWASLDCMRSAFSGGDWSRAYGSLVLGVGQALRIDSSRSTSARVDRGEAVVAPGVGTEGPISDRAVFVPVTGSSRRLELAGLVGQSRRADVAKRVLDQLEKDDLIQSMPPAQPGTSAERLDFLLADLLGATLCDAQDELWVALEELDRMTSAERRSELLRFLTEPPPWPPASIRKLNEKPEAETLLAILAGELTSDSALREWLLARWREPEKPIDQQLLTRLSQAEGGLLTREPRFRSWLRAEWRAWARQRYRRVARVASGAYKP